MACLNPSAADEGTEDAMALARSSTGRSNRDYRSILRRAIYQDWPRQLHVPLKRSYAGERLYNKS